ncbi:hydroxymethylpyrimidine/phosphomethylpyrimidine kinase [Companilactobacillus sp. RD055328]|uniref:bifunctional hydroxymethylpyrimidine kinase/phosphomethylpyrimidine kinase n=1 Tax=Companilactobacillus sp. RD055328 TaxID=2916634 RepID=UPI001FC87AC7|nr:bifunctional hydroxymethylpyrimidine kinase/phosphomethylpyrimidine kinase [Companilactobacillus sp. RD055328]GKQ42199.1 hydroxymethylpyrimidine/phosphomethylpyrimidine kinase [Companilactobacillus sp. RD055328]
MEKVLTIAGSDSSGGAGIQADLKTMAAHKKYGMSVITAITAQNTQQVFDVMDVTPEVVSWQLDAVFTDIYPDAVKIGMVSNEEIVHVIAKKLKEYDVKNIVVDPVMVATSGSNLSNGKAIEALKSELFPLASVITPNTFEAEVLSGSKIESADQMEAVAKEISDNYNCSVLVKGGHLGNDANDYLYIVNEEGYWLKGERIDNNNTHGTGCTLSSAIACNLSDRIPLLKSVEFAKKYLTGALKVKLNLGKGSGPVDHLYNL